MVDTPAVRARLEARFAAGWPRAVSVPEAWLPHLAELDARLAALDPGYELAQVKTKFGGLRFYVEQPYWLPCCAAWHAAHPIADDAGVAAQRAWEVAGEVHDRSPEHVAGRRAREAVVAGMDALVDAAEAASYRW